MFWKFNSILTTSKIDEILETEDVNLKQILDEEDVLQECKAQNKKLIQFLVRPENITGLLNFVTNEPAADASDDKAYRYSNISHELLTADVQEITEKLVENNDALEQLYHFLESQLTSNSLLCSFVVKIICFLVNRKSEHTIAFLTAQPKAVSLFIEKLDTSAVKDLLLELTTQIQSTEANKTATEWFVGEKFVAQLYAIFDTSIENELQQSNAAQLLIDIISRLRMQINAQDQEETLANKDIDILCEIESKENIELLLDHIFAENKRSECSLTHGIAVLKEIIQLSSYAGDSSALNPECHELVRENFSKAMVPKLECFHKYLLEPPAKTVQTSVGHSELSVGRTRVEITDLLTHILRLNDEELNQQLISLGTIRLIMDMFATYVWNSVFHTKVNMCLYAILHNENNSDSNPSSKSSNDILHSLFMECQLLQWIMSLWEENENQQNLKNPRRGYMGHITEVANHVSQLSGSAPLPSSTEDTKVAEDSNETERVTADSQQSNSTAVKSLIEQLPSNVKEKWQEFTSVTLSEVNKRNETSLGGMHPRDSVSIESDTEIDILRSIGDNKQIMKDYSEFSAMATFLEKAATMDSFPDLIASLDTRSGGDASPAKVDANAETKLEGDDGDDDIWEEKELQFVTPQAQQISASAADDFLSPHSSSSEEDEEEANEGNDNGKDREEKRAEIDVKEMFTQDLDGVSDRDMWMDIDDSCNKTPANDDDNSGDMLVAMDTSNPWDNTPSSGETSQQQASTEEGQQQQQQAQSGWADFSQFDSVFPPQPSSSSSPFDDSGGSKQSSDSAWATFSDSPSTFVENVAAARETPQNEQNLSNSSQAEAAAAAAVSVNDNSPTFAQNLEDPSSEAQTASSNDASGTQVPDCSLDNAKTSAIAAAANSNNKCQVEDEKPNSHDAS